MTGRGKRRDSDERKESKNARTNEKGHRRRFEINRRRRNLSSGGSVDEKARPTTIQYSADDEYFQDLLIPGDPHLEKHPHTAATFPHLHPHYRSHPTKPKVGRLRQRTSNERKSALS